jgi:hypothetical protein
MGIKHKPWYSLMPDENLEICEENLKLFFKTMFERQEVWHNRFILKKERPWTKDKFLANNKFTNVYRELDRNSQWQIKNVFLKESNRKDLLWKIMLFRIFNNPETFEWIGRQEKSFSGFMPSYNEYDKNEWKDLIYGYRETGNNPFTNAYLVNSMACPDKSRDWCYTMKVVPTIHENIPNLNKILIKAKNPDEIINALLKLPSVAAFIAHEFYQDFTYAPRYSNINLMKFNQNDFTNVGPGASVGIRLIFPNLSGKSQIDGIYRLRGMANEELSKIGNFKYLNWGSKQNSYYITKGGDITLHQIEMWLCEFQKYWKMKIGMGKQRSVFQPRTLR